MRHRMTLGKFRKLRREQERRRQNLRVRLRSLYMGGSRRERSSRRDVALGVGPDRPVVAGGPAGPAR
jgi:hypothetical protein